MHRSRTPSRPHRLIGGTVFLACLLRAAAQLSAPAPILPADDPVRLGDFEVVAGDEDEDYDGTGMGSVEQQVRDEPFSNDLIRLDDFTLDAGDLEFSAEASAVAETSSADRIAGEDRLNLRGFPTPMLRNGFIQVGIPEVLNTGQTIVIQGALVPVFGRAAPGGIQNFLTVRPRTKEVYRFGGATSNQARSRLTFETTGPLVPKRIWQRVALEWRRRDGPEEFAREDVRMVSTVLTFRHSRTASTLVSLDYRDTTALATPGIPEYIPIGATKAVGPYLPLALFNANGPEAGVRRRSAVGSVQFDGQPMPRLSIRAGLEGWWRDVEQDRFTSSQLDLATGLFTGIREPRRLEQPQHALASQLEATLRFSRFRAEHKLMLSASHTWGRYLREERALSIAERNALPLDVRRFNPFAPNYYAPDYDPLRYNRVITDRLEHARYGSIELSDRAAWRRGKIVVTAGLRYDRVAQEVEDRRVGATLPSTSDSTGQLSHHAGLNLTLRPSRLLVFATTSSALDPSTPVDARTGKIQENETTQGYEGGLIGRAAEGRLTLSASGFLLYNRNIARRNPLYNDPVADADQTQPQLVASGEERFSGCRLDLQWKPVKTVQVTLKGNYLRALTTASPDLPQEVGRPLTRLPAYNVMAVVRYRADAPKGGLTWNANWQYLDGYVATYGDARREFLAYSGYGLVSFNAGWFWRTKTRQFDLEAGVRNLFDRDLLASHARTTADRELTFSARLVF